MIRVGVISDTHDLLRPEALAALAGVDRILHGGDVCSPSILEALRGIAPLDAVRGNCDGGDWAQLLPLCDTWPIGEVLIHGVHRLQDLDLVPAAAGIGIVIYGHSHQPALEEREGVLYLNPGSAGPRRFQLPISLAIVELTPGARPRVAFRGLG